MEEIAENLWIIRYPLTVLGTEEGRTVTLIRLRSGEMVIHSSAPFTPADVSAIKELGPPAALVEATLFHDTFVAQAHAALPGVPYVAPACFHRRTRGLASSLLPPPESWAGEIDVILLEGMPRVQEHLFFHRPSATLIVADLVFNFPPSAPRWTRLFFRVVGGINEYPGMSRLFRALIADRAAFNASLQRMMQCDFQRLIVGHGAIIETAAKEKLGAALQRGGF